MVEKTTVDGPLSDRPLSSAPESMAPPDAKAQAMRPKVLAVDDEELMCELLSAMLGEDFEVTTLTDAREALARLLRGEYFDLILCDLMMPGVTGMQVFEQLSRARPEQAKRMIFMTGGTYTDEAHDFLAEPGRVQLQKPFRHEGLLEVVRKRLQALAPNA